MTYYNNYIVKESINKASSSYDDIYDGNYVVRLHLKCLTWFQRIRLVICDESLFDAS